MAPTPSVMQAIYSGANPIVAHTATLAANLILSPKPVHLGHSGFFIGEFFLC